jgi:LPXTG-motif cell wall-anchored protein
MSRVHLFGGLLVMVTLLTVPVIASAAGPVTVTLAAQNDSGESGTAVLTDLGGGKTKVEITISGQPAGVPQPVHIHMGTCTNLDPKSAYALTNVVDGKSETTVHASVESLMNGNFAINGHKSAQEASVYVFCGAISVAAVMPATLPKTGGSLNDFAPLVLALGLLIFGAGLLVRRFAH